jgi:hypothetical protein
MIFRAILKTAVVTVFLLVGLWIVRQLRLILRRRIETRIYASASREKKSAWHVAVGYLGPVILAIGALLRWVIILGLIEIYLTVTLGFYSDTREISLTVTRWIFSQLETLGNATVDYLPNLLVVAMIAVITNYVVRLIRLIFDQIRKGDLKIHGFYPDWAEPTDKLVRMLVLVLALIVAFPYLPYALARAFANRIARRRGHDLAATSTS